MHTDSRNQGCIELSSRTHLLFNEKKHTWVHLTDLRNEARIEACDDGTSDRDHEVFIKTLDKGIDSPNASPLKTLHKPIRFH